MTWFSNLVSNFASGVSDYATSSSGIDQLVNLAGTALVDSQGWNQAKIPQTGYQGGIPALRAQRAPVPQAVGQEMPDGSVQATGIQGLAGTQDAGRQVQMMYDPNRRPGSSGRRYFTDMQYLTEEDDAAAADTRMAEQVTKLQEANIRNPARQTRAKPQTMAAGGLAELGKEKYLNGNTDGMADEVPARIDGRQEARLSDGEFVIPADVVSHLGNGNSDAGAEVLKQMMSRVRKERTGNKEQGKQINPKTILPV